jgi:hypothetical protein
MTCEGAVPGYAAPLNLTGHTGQVVEWEYRNENTTWTKFDSQELSLTVMRWRPFWSIHLQEVPTHPIKQQFFEQKL